MSLVDYAILFYKDVDTFEKDRLSKKRGHLIQSGCEIKFNRSIPERRNKSVYIIEDVDRLMLREDLKIKYMRNRL